MEISGESSADLLVAMVLSSGNTTSLLTEEQRAFVDAFIEACWKLQVDNFNIRDFSASICSVDVLPVELIWRLHRSGLLDVISYLSCVSSSTLSAKANHLSASLTQLLCGDEEESTISKNIIRDICSSLILHSFTTSSLCHEQHLGKIRKVAADILNTITANVLDSIASSKYDIPYRLVIFGAVRENGVLSNDILEKFSIQQLLLIISHSPVNKDYQTVSIQDQWSLLRLPSYLINTFIQLLVPLTTLKIISLLRQVLELSKINWHMFLGFISTFIIACSDAKIELQALIKEILIKSFEYNDYEALLASFLIVRQAALEGPNVFPSYAEWFKSIDKLANDKKSFTFLMEFLTNLVPFEPVDYLKVHVLTPPHPPNKCASVLYDYVNLAKVRLAELEINICETQNALEEEKAAREVEESVQLFSKRCTAPTCITEMWLFRKSYYLHKFLPHLLKSSESCSSSHSRHKFIEALYNSGKMPLGMYEEYTREKKKLL